MLILKRIRPGRAPGLSLAAGLALCAVLPAAAQVTPLPLMPVDRTWPGVTSDDLDRLHAAEARLYEGRSIGTIERWRNPDTGTAGEVKLERRYEAKGTPCRSLSYTVRFANVKAPNHYALNWCRVPSGDWKVVSEGLPK